MKHLDLESYRRVNESFHRRLVCRIGVDCGFFVEMNYMVNAMLYCLANRIQFQLFSRDANFGTGIGWTEYFQPFCKEVYEPYHLKYNLHQPPTWKRILKKALLEYDSLEVEIYNQNSNRKNHRAMDLQGKSTSESRCSVCGQTSFRHS